MQPLCSSVLETIGNTPLVALDRLTAHYGCSGRILAKLEFFNPGLSKKDRIALFMIRESEEAGLLKPGQTVVELTSGNTGTGLAIVCALTGHPFVAVMSRGNSRERMRMMQALGAEVVLVDQAEEGAEGKVSGSDLDLVEERAQEITEERKAYRANQFLLEANVHAEEVTGKELWEQSAHAIQAFVDVAGSGGSFTGCARALKRQSPGIRCYLAEPEEAAWLGTTPYGTGRHKIQGCGYSRDLPLLDPALVEKFVTVSDERTLECARDLAKIEGILGGFSSGANLAAALDLLEGPEKGNTLGILICDSGAKYLSTDLYP
ncbi:MAG TPA: cysteine synthase family protein [Synergistaceae bacterium]|nr:cysteine synthase family protein [Synergistaceae bacterium]HPQ38162.1 cysteine synthase family protein [Synergistaceae bacterium]